MCLWGRATEPTVLPWGKVGATPWGRRVIHLSCALGIWLPLLGVMSGSPEPGSCSWCHNRRQLGTISGPQPREALGGMPGRRPASQTRWWTPGRIDGPSLGRIQNRVFNLQALARYNLAAVDCGWCYFSSYYFNTWVILFSSVFWGSKHFVLFYWIICVNFKLL